MDVVRFSLQTRDELVVDTADNKQTAMKANIIKALEPTQTIRGEQTEALWMNVIHSIKQLFVL